MSTKPTSTMKRRLNGIIALILAAFTITIVANLFKISVTDSAKYQNLANNQQFMSRTINANRGSIVDINGQILAQSATVYTVFIDPNMLKKVDSDKEDLIVNSLSEILEVDKDTISTKAQKDSKYEILKQKVEKPIVDKINTFMSDNNINCIFCDPDTKRYYPQNDLASSVIGFTNYDGNGQYGLEAQYDEYLSGIDGKIISAKDARGNEMPYRYDQNFESQPGNTLVLNIDTVLQHYLEKELEKAVIEHGAKNRGCGIIMNAKTGQILAMATEPDYDLNNPTEISDPTVAAYLESIKSDEEEYQKERAIAWETQWKNKAITELYYPGSVFKVITGSAALEEKKITLTDKFTCGGFIIVEDRKFKCWSAKDHGAQTFVEAMTNSCNPAFVQIGQRLGSDLFIQYFKAYGLDTTTGIDLPSEAESIYYNFKSGDNKPVELASCSFGQTNKITPIEMITAYAAAVNGGNLVTPYVVDKIVDVNGNIVKQFEPEIKRQVISEETSKIMRETLETVVKTKPTSNSYVLGYQIGGKSGTSQKQDEKIKTGIDTYVASYCGFAPANDPEIIMLVMIDNPTGEYYGSQVAAPVVTNVFKEALPYLGYLPQYTDEELENLEVIVPDVTDQPFDKAKATLLEQDLIVEKVGDGDTVIKQIPTSGSKMIKNGNIILYTEENSEEKTVTVPKLANMSLQDANIAITNAGLNIKPTGIEINQKGAIVIEQNPAAGNKVPKGTIIEVKFVANDPVG